MTKQPNQPVLLIIRGIPGSGKSYFAHHLYNAIGAQDAILLDPDTTDYDGLAYKRHVEEQNKEGVDPKLHAYRFLRAQAYEGIKNSQIIIWNQPFSNLEILQKVTARLEEYATDNAKHLTIILVEVAIEPAVAKQRVIKRVKEGGHGPSENTFNRFVNDYATAASLGYVVIPINGLESSSQSVSIVVQRITAIRT